MPYIAFKSFPKAQATKEAVVEKINEIFLKVTPLKGRKQKSLQVDFTPII